MTNEAGTNQYNKSKPTNKTGTESGSGCLWAIFWLAMGMAMVIWPDAFYAPGPCDPDEIIGCFISNYWGRTDAITISFTFGLIPVVSEFWKSRNQGNGQHLSNHEEG